MTEPGLDELLDALEKAITRLADDQARLDDLVGAYEEATAFSARAAAELERLSARLLGPVPAAGLPLPGPEGRAPTLDP